MSENLVHPVISCDLITYFLEILVKSVFDLQAINWQLKARNFCETSFTLLNKMIVTNSDFIDFFK